ncbi:MAG: CRTAC1 family protein, partial [Cyclobacteriaceae bacterium]
MFVLLAAEETGIDFINQVQDTKDFNILNYRNFYNGGGVAIGDINGDSLVDIYFTANQNTNRLYLNKGDWKFEDVTDKAEVGGTKSWSTGVTMVDINADGWLDIYVCNSGDIGGGNKENELFINNHDGTFSEQASRWGLGSKGFSTHASFFDYDADGDLDCYLLNNSFRSPDRIEFYKKSREDIDVEGGDKLFRNDGNHFTDVSQEAGIFTSDIGFGLGVSVSDLNQDLLPDIYISNDFWERDYLYINRGDGTFSEELETRLSICSMNSMGADIADLNNSGGPEIMTTDMLPPDNYRLKTMTQFEPTHIEAIKNEAGYHHQMMQNALHFNDGNAQFQEMAFMSQVAATDWSWGALMLDLDLDGWKDIFVSNGIMKDLTDFDFVDFIGDKQEVEKIVSESRQVDFRDFLPHMPSTKLSNYAFLNQQGKGFKNDAMELGLATPSFSNGAAYGDLDNDGDLDLVVNNANMPCFIYRNEVQQKNNNKFLKLNLIGPSKNPFGIGAKVKLIHGDQQQELQHYLSRGYESSVAPGLLFGLGEVKQLDSLIIQWPDQRYQVLTGISSDQTLVLNYEESIEGPFERFKTYSPLLVETTKDIFPTPIWHRENTFNDFDQEGLLIRKISTEGPKL